ncbi:hypothetical protein MMYC01_206910 [Madurella mycetomatis]|uniref:Proteasome assembly chaperone 3 n=1 Tax=Madurella mycetomatis TaxID=100816 RepID=A0A175VPL8_9PEZI|nr:hypothetical protein MMYC01_210363 [Madurella mycetomatis]KXX77378.1 hypothetical protein MMYC01_206910 [Madurella mycetomatis]
METPAQLSIPLPRSLDSRIYLHLTVKSKAILLFLTTASMEEASAPTPLGSFVYALPDKYNPSQPLSTPLCTVEPTLEFATRLAKLLARKTQLPTYVGNSISFASTGLGGTVEEEMEAFKKVVEVVVSKLQPAIESTEAPSGSSHG